MAYESIDYGRAKRVLARDPVIRALMRKYGDCGLAAAQRSDTFTALTHAIISQQLSTKAAATIARRFDALLGGSPTPAAIAGRTDVELRAVGLSGQKVRYIRDLCARVADRSLPIDTLDALSDAAVIEALTSVKGIGRWTAEMFLMFRLHRPDVLPLGDLGIVKAVQRAYGLRAAPRPERLIRIGEPWRPYRSVACWYLWASLDALAGSNTLIVSQASPGSRRLRPRGARARDTVTGEAKPAGSACSPAEPRQITRR